MKICGLCPIQQDVKSLCNFFFLTKHLPTTYVSLQMSHSKHSIRANKDFANLCQIWVLTWETWHKFLFSALGLITFYRFSPFVVPRQYHAEQTPSSQGWASKCNIRKLSRAPSAKQSHCCFSFPQSINKTWMFSTSSSWKLTRLV